MKRTKEEEGKKKLRNLQGCLDSGCLYLSNGVVGPSRIFCALSFIFKQFLELLPQISGMLFTRSRFEV